MFEWITATLAGKILATAAVSAVPVIELRGGIPFGVYHGLPIWLSYAVSVFGNMLPIPFILRFLKRIFNWMKSFEKLGLIVQKLEEKGHIKGQKVIKYRKLGLFILVAIPLPGTGAWTGALVATVLEMPWKEALPMIFLGVLAAGFLVTGITFGFTSIF